MENEPGNTLKETLVKSDLAGAILDLGEIGMDTLFTEGVLKEIPVLQSVLALGKTWAGVRDYFFAKRLLAFLKSFSELTAEERRDLVVRLDRDEAFGHYAGERLLDLLSRLDDERKPELIAKALKLYAAGRISGSQLQRVYHAVERLQLCDLGELEKFCRADEKPRIADGDPVAVNFISAGLAYVSSGRHDGGGVHPTETARVLLAAIADG
ncbi:MAG: hypothetical protein HGA75_03070 [Thiobacillus sp.]|nr:hypothetical protein [Thiobacillus sp.]